MEKAQEDAWHLRKQNVEHERDQCNYRKALEWLASPQAVHQ